MNAVKENGNELHIEVARQFLPLLKPARYKGAWGGRGSGKSHFFAELMVSDCYSNPYDGVCIREYQSSLKYSSKKLLEEKIKKFGLDRRYNQKSGHIGPYQIRDDRIITPFGKVIIFIGMQEHNATSIKSLEKFKRFFVEEANDLSHNSINILRPTARGDDVEMHFAWNPRLPSDPIDSLLRGDELPPRSITIETNYLNNPWITEDQIQEAEYDKRRDFDKYLHVWMGGYEQHSEARVFSNWTIEDFEAPVDVDHRFGSDFGFNSPSTLIRSHLIGKKLYIDYEAYRFKCELPDLKELYHEVPESEKWPIIGDSSRPETISYLNNNGFKVFASTKGKGSIKEGVEFLKGYDIIVHPRCVYTINELENYKWKVDQNIIDPMTNRPAVLPVLVDDHNHIIDALRYAHEGHRRHQKIEREKKTYNPPIPTVTPYRN